MNPNNTWKTNLSEIKSNVLKKPEVKIAIGIAILVGSVFVLSLIAKLIGKSADNFNYMVNSFKNG